MRVAGAVGLALLLCLIDGVRAGAVAKPAPHQMNLADDARYAAKLADREALLLAEMRRLHDPYRLWNRPDDGLVPPPEPAPSPRSKGAEKR